MTPGIHGKSHLVSMKFELQQMYLEKKQFVWRRKSQINMDEIWWSNYQNELNQKQNKKVNEMEVAESRAYLRQKQQAGYVGQPTPKKHKEYNR